MIGSKRSKRVDSPQFAPVHGVEKVEKPNEVAFVLDRTSSAISTPRMDCSEQHSAEGWCCRG